MSNETKYYWTSKHPLSIDEFVKKYKPSVIEQDDAPWLWVGQASTNFDPEEEERRHTRAIGAAQVVVEQLTDRVQAIEADDDIPVRAKKGVKSKKACRDELHAEAAEKLKKISEDANWTTGKWLFFPKHENVDRLWAMIARSVAYGPLKEAGVKLAKVATTLPEVDEDSAPLHAVIVYVENLYDKEMATRVLVSLIKDHGLEPTACKTDLYTLVHLDSNHPSKLRSSIWRVNELIDGGAEGVKKLKAQYKPGSEKKWGPKESSSDPVADEDQPQISVEQKDENAAGKSGGDPQTNRNGLAKRASFLDNVEDGIKKRKSSPVKAKPAAKRVKSAATLYKENDIFAADSDDD